MTSSRASRAYCFAAAAALLAACATDAASTDTSNDDSNSRGRGGLADCGGSSNPEGWDGEPAPDTASPPRKDAGNGIDSGFGFEAGIDGGSCGADFLNDPANCGACDHDC